MKICVTGHRPNGLPIAYGYNMDNSAWQTLKEYLKLTITKCYEYAAENEELTLISGMALGVDTIYWQAAKELREENRSIKIEAAIPFEGQEKRWNAHSQQEYKNMLEQSDIVTIVSPGGYAAYKMESRNRYMVNNADIVIAVFNGKAGGTAKCIDYAEKQNKTIININPNEII